MNDKKIQRELQKPFKESDLEWRVQAVGKTGDRFWARVLVYVTNRAIQQRLDKAVGAFNWRNEFKPLPNSVGDGALCGISIKLGDEWVTKWDGADNTDIEATKGGLSGSMKRAAVQWGIGRYLYDVEAMYADVITKEQWQKLQYHEKQEWERAQTKQKEVFYWKPPKLSAKFLPHPYIKLDAVKAIKKLIKDTGTDEKAVCEAYGVDDIRDLFSHEAAEIVMLLTKKLQRMKEEENEPATTKNVA